MSVSPGDGGGQPAWLANDGSVKVDVNRLEDFATRVNGELEKNFQPSFKNGIQPLMQELSQAPFGMGGLREGRMFGSAHAMNLQATGQMLADVQKSLMAISMAATDIAREYGGGDAMNQATLDDVQNAFGASGGAQTLDSLLKNAGSGEAGGIPVSQRALDAVREGENMTNPAASGADRDTLRSGENIGSGPGALRLDGDNEGIETRHPEDEVRRVNEEGSQPGWISKAAQGFGDAMEGMVPRPSPYIYY